MASWQFLIASNTNAVLADVSQYAFRPTVSPRLSLPSEQRYRVPLTPEVLALSGGDGYPLFFPGLRRMIALRDGVCVANDTLWIVQPQGGPDDAWLDLVGYGPMARWVARWVQDADGQIFDGPSADGTDRGLDLPAGIIADPATNVVPAQLLKQALDNTIANDGRLGVLTTGGTWSTSTVGLFAFRVGNQSPLRLSDLARLLVDTGTLDIVVQPTSTGSEQGIVSGVNRAGTDLPGVSFDYGIGAFNVAWAYPEASLDGFCNKLWYELGARDGSHFKNNVTKDAPGVSVDPTTSQALFDVWHDIVIHDDWDGAIPNDSDLYQAFVRNYNAEQTFRMMPRQLVRLVPQPGLAPEPWTDYQLGDTPRVNVAQLGLDIDAASFRVIGWDASPPDDGGGDEVQLLIGWSPSST